MNARERGGALEPRGTHEEMRKHPVLRRPYNPPTLILYGSLTDLTRAEGNNIFDGLTATGNVS